MNSSQDISPEIPVLLRENVYRVKNWPINFKHAMLIHIVADVEDEFGIKTSYTKDSMYGTCTRETDNSLEYKSNICTIEFRTGVIKFNDNITNIQAVYCLYTSLIEKQK